jgi:hypothetical protein
MQSQVEDSQHMQQGSSQPVKIKVVSACTIATMYIRPHQKSVLDLVFTHSKKYSRPAFKGPVASYNESTTQMNSRKRNEQRISNHLVVCQIIKHM